MKPSLQRQNGAALFSDVLGTAERPAQLSDPQPAATAGQEPAQPPNQLVAVIGLGGSGHKVVNFLKTQFIDAQGRIPDHVVMLSLDLAEDPVTCIAANTGAVVQLERGSEFLRLERVPLAGIKRNPAPHRLLVERVGMENLQKIPRPYIDKGAAQERLQGAIAYLWNIHRIEAAFNALVARLTARTRDLDDALLANTSLSVYVVCSNAGGQGAGAFLDAINLFRQKLMEQSSLGASCTLAGVLILPGALCSHENRRMRANAYSLALETNSLMLGRHPIELEYATGTRLRLLEAPCTYLYCFDSIDEHGRRSANHDEVCRQAAHALWLLSSSAVGMREINDALNDSPVLQGVSHGGYGAYLGSAGVTTIRFAAAQVDERCRVRQCLRMIRLLLNENEEGADPPPDEPLGDLVTGVALDKARKQLHQSEDGAPLTLTLTTPAAFDHFPVEEIPARARTYAENFQRRRVFEEIFPKMAARAAALGGEQRDRLGRALAAYRKSGRQVAALRWLRANLHALAQTQRALAGVQRRQAEMVEQQRAALAAAGEALDRSPEGLLPFLRRNQVRSALTRYVDAAAGLAHTLIDQRSEELLAGLLAATGEWLHEEARREEQGIVRLQQAAEWLIARENELAQRTAAGAEIALAETPVVDFLYRRFAGDPAAGIQQALSQGDWVELTAEQIAARLMQSVAETFAPVLQMTVEDVLTLRWPDRSPQHWLERFQLLAAAAWNVDPALLPNGGADLPGFLTIGVPDAQNSRFAGGGHTLVTTGDPERILILRTVYGASFDALKPFPLWKQAYEVLSKERPLHVLPGFDTHQDRSDEVFAVGLVFGHIFNERTWFYYRPADKLREALQLGHGRSKALAALAANHPLQQEILARVKAQVAAEGVQQAIERLQAWIDQETTGNDPLLQRLRLAARNYLTQLRSAV
jgi:hypothetical protein